MTSKQLTAEQIRLENILDEFEIVEHEQAHAAVMAAVGASPGGLENLEEESSRLSQENGEDNLKPFLDQFAGMINSSNLRVILEEQDHMLKTMEVTNEKLASLNEISERKFTQVSSEMRQQTQALLAMKKQLDSCFRRIRSLKSKLAIQYPQAYQDALSSQKLGSEDKDVS